MEGLVLNGSNLDVWGYELSNNVLDGKQFTGLSKDPGERATGIIHDVIGISGARSVAFNHDGIRSII